MPAFETLLAGFAAALRHAGTPVTPDRTQLFVRAAGELGVEDPQHVYWAGRATLCTGPDDFTRYDAVFQAWFSGDLPHAAPRREQPPTVTQASLDEDEGGAGGGDDETEQLRAMASTTEVLRQRDVARLSDAERARVNRLFAHLRVRPPVRRGIRRTPAPTGEVDPRRTLRAQLRRVGEPAALLHRRREHRPRRLVLLIDVSGSMAPYADSLLRLAHTIVHRAPGAEVFTIGTRLTHLTRAMRRRDPDEALSAAGDTVPDWSGGTRLGEVLKVFLDRWGQRGMARGAVVVVCSDGWERGDATLLGAQAERLHRLAHRVIWLNPHRGKAGYQPVQAGIAAALPHVDELVAGHSLAAFDELLEVVARA